MHLHKHGAIFAGRVDFYAKSTPNAFLKPERGRMRS